MATSFALVDGGEIFVYVEERIASKYGHEQGSITVWAVIDCMTDRQLFPAPTDDYEARGWWTCVWSEDDPPIMIRVDHAPRKEVVGARLRDEFSALGEPTGDLEVELDANEWARISDFEDPSPWARCYEVLTVDVPVDPTIIDDVLQLRPGRPRLAGSPEYRAKLPNSLRYQTQYAHLFPGFIDGFREAAVSRLDGLTDLDVKLYVHGRSPSIFVKVPGGVGYAYTNDSFHLPRRIDGENLDDAMSKWHAALDEVEQRVRDASQVCQHCKGTGRPHETVPKKRGKK